LTNPSQILVSFPSSSDARLEESQLFPMEDLFLPRRTLTTLKIHKSEASFSQISLSLVSHLFQVMLNTSTIHLCATECTIRSTSLRKPRLEHSFHTLPLRSLVESLMLSTNMLKSLRTTLLTQSFSSSKCPTLTGVCSRFLQHFRELSLLSSTILEVEDKT